MRLSGSHKLAAIVLCSSILLAQPPSTPAKRPFTIDDIYRKESINGYTSPDGAIIAYNRSAGMEEQMQRFGDYRGPHRNDVWVHFNQYGATTQIFKPGDDAMDGATLSWSPDGQYLALRESRNDRHQVHVWKRVTGEKFAVTDVYLDTFAELAFRPFTWVSPTELVMAMPPQPSIPLDPRLGLVGQAALNGWIESIRGVKPTSSVRETSALRDPTADRKQMSLLLINVERKISVVLMSGDAANVTPAPAWRGFALLQLGAALQLPSDEVTPAHDASDRLVQSSRVVLAGPPDGRELVTVAGADHVIDKSLQWAPDGSQIAFIDRSVFAREAPNLYVYSLARKSSTKVHFGGKDHAQFGASDLRWIHPHRLLVAASYGASAKGWYVVQENGSTIELRTNGRIPLQIYPDSGCSTFRFLEGGRVWRYDLDKESSQCLTCSSSVEISSVAWSSGDTLVVSGKEGGTPGFYMIGEQGLRKLILPAGQRTFSHSHYDQSTGAAVVWGQSASGWSLWTLNAFNGTEKLLVRENNGFQEEIDRGESRLIDYKALDGQPLKASVLLPYGYQPGKRYPMLVDVYPGTVFSSVQPRQNSLNAYSLSVLAFSAQGYVVLKPSMPLPPFGVRSDNLAGLTNGVLPAVEKLVELGIADSDRIAVIGHSYGGYGVYGLITQTNRFKAAIAYAGSSDLISRYGQFEATGRYLEQPPKDNFTFQWAEGGQGALGVPPWGDPLRYVRNSPLFYAPRVQTPILILQGDMDFVPIQQGEEFFTAMLRLNKPARFVRYWGEGHNDFSPANARNLHQEILGWLERYLAPRSKSAPTAR